AVFGSSFTNFVFFHRMKFGDRKTTISVAIETLSQEDIISANPIPVYVTNFLVGTTSGTIIALSVLVHGATVTAIPIAGFAVLYGFNDPIKVTIVALLCASFSALWGFIGSLIFKKFKIRRVDELAKLDKEATPA